MEKILSATDKEGDDIAQEQSITYAESQEESESSMASIPNAESSVVSTEPELTESKMAQLEPQQVDNGASNRYALRRSRNPPKRSQ